MFSKYFDHTKKVYSQKNPGKNLYTQIPFQNPAACLSKSYRLASPLAKTA
jgi:hypothetical protein